MKTIMNGTDLDSLPEIFRFRSPTGLELEGRVYRTAITGKDDEGHAVISQVAPFLTVANVGAYLDDARPTGFTITFTGPDATPDGPLVHRITGNGDTGTSPVTGHDRDIVTGRVREWALAFLAADPPPVEAWLENGDWKSAASSRP